MKKQFYPEEYEYEYENLGNCVSDFSYIEQELENLRKEIKDLKDEVEINYKTCKFVDVLLIVVFITHIFITNSL